MARRLLLLFMLTVVGACGSFPPGPGSSPREGMVWEESAFLQAVQSGNHLLVEKYLAAGIPVNCSNESGITGLMLASQRGDLAMTRLLLRFGASLNLEDHHGLTALDYTRYHPESGIFPLLVAHGAQYGHLRNR